MGIPSLRFGNGTQNGSQETPDLPIPEEPVVGAIFLVVIRLHTKRLAGGVEHAAQWINILLPADSDEQTRQVKYFTLCKLLYIEF